MPCQAERRACPYGAAAHMTFEDVVALAQYDEVADSGAWDLLGPESRESLESGYRADPTFVRHAVEAAYARQVTREDETAAGPVGGVDWGNPSTDVEGELAALDSRVAGRRADCIIGSIGMGGRLEGLPRELIREELLDLAQDGTIPQDGAVMLIRLGGFERSAPSSAKPVAQGVPLMGANLRADEAGAARGARSLRNADPAAAHEAQVNLASRLGVYLGPEPLAAGPDVIRAYRDSLPGLAEQQLRSNAERAGQDVSIAMAYLDPLGGWMPRIAPSLPTPPSWDELADDPDTLASSLAAFDKGRAGDSDPASKKQLLTACVDYYRAMRDGDWEEASMAAEDITITARYEEPSPYWGNNSHNVRINGVRGTGIEAAPFLAWCAKHGAGMTTPSDVPRHLHGASEPYPDHYPVTYLPAITNYARYGDAALTPDGHVIQDGKQCAKRALTNLINGNTPQAQDKPATGKAKRQQAAQVTRTVLTHALDAGLDPHQADILANLTPIPD
ncbi:hypothetical protein EMO89_00250 [Bifidobacterium tissieri]|uniref:Uncharacterized protein n=1 Tax=Bifidobacterium tissieri TaxID=1630162 RepID=A0A5M9ZWT6_9BIFI|nr:hypothetical protein [Bifidobacterium tissieri]KAA8831995.1 hypothetical protein EMO89_00250 [Bifidobacterium tissieri]